MKKEMTTAVVTKGETRKRRFVRLHPLAGRAGFGGPIAPPGWRWRAGRRLSDMSFFSPEGKAFRTQIALLRHLAETPGTPSLSQFRFDVTTDDFKDSAMPGKLLPIPEFPRSKGIPENAGVHTRKKVKLITQAEFAPKKKKKSVHSYNKNVKTEEFSRALTNHSSKMSPGHTSVEGLNFSPAISNGLNSGGDYKHKEGYSFTSILASQTSYVVLRKNENILQEFLQDSARLKEKTEDELEELRVHLSNRKLDSVNLSKYHVEVLRAFFFLLRNQEAPPSFGKKEILEVCSNWSCKRKRHWCLLERLCFQCLVNNNDQTGAGSESQGAIGATAIHDIVEGIKKAQTRERASPAIKADAELALHLRSLSNGARNEYQAEPSHTELAVHLRKPSKGKINGQKGSRKEANKVRAIEECFEDMTKANYMTSFGAEHQTFIQKDGCNNSADALQRAVSSINTQYKENDISFKVPAILEEREGRVHPSGYCKSLVLQQELGIMYGDSRQKSLAPYHQHALGEEHEAVLDAFIERKKLLYNAKEASQKTMPKDPCTCDACVLDPSFCYGCECSLCRAAISPKQNWSFLCCPGCHHVCHLECALKAKKAGVVKTMGLDGEYICPSCLQKHDLISFWKERVKDAAMSAETSVVEKHLFSAVLVLSGTQRKTYQSIHEKLKDLHSYILYNTNCPGLTKWLHEIQKDVDTLDDSADKIEDVEEISDELLLHFHAIDLLAEEAKVLEWKKKVELDHAELVQVENIADAERAQLQETMEEMKKVEEEVMLRAERVTSSKRNLQRAEIKLRLLKTSCRNRVLPEVQIEEQRKIVNLELAELRRIQGKGGSISYESGDSSVDNFPLVAGRLKIQRRRVESARVMLEHLLALESSLM